MSESCGAHSVNQSTENHWRVGSAGKGLMAVSTKLNDTDVDGDGEVCIYCGIRWELSREIPL